MACRATAILRMFGTALRAWWDDDLLWVYYSCQILLFGAEFTRVYAQRQGTKPAPESFAEIDLEALSKTT